VSDCPGGNRPSLFIFCSRALRSFPSNNAMFPPLWDCADEQRAENGLDLKISDFGISDSRFQI
jgi:hypothetical protein